MYYSLTGTVSQLSGSCTNSAYCDPDLEVGTPVAFTFLIDFAAAGQGLEGQTVDPSRFLYFYAEYVSGPSFIDAHYPGALSFVTHNKFGTDDFFGSMGYYGVLFCDSQGANVGDAPLVFFSTSKTVSQWAVGEVIYGHQSSFLQTVEYQLTLSVMESVPIAGTLFLLGPGLAAIGLLRRRRKG